MSQATTAVEQEMIDGKIYEKNPDVNSNATTHVAA